MLAARSLVRARAHTHTLSPSLSLSSSWTTLQAHAALLTHNETQRNDILLFQVASSSTPRAHPVTPRVHDKRKLLLLQAQRFRRLACVPDQPPFTPLASPPSQPPPLSPLLCCSTLIMSEHVCCVCVTVCITANHQSQIITHSHALAGAAKCHIRSSLRTLWYNTS